MPSLQNKKILLGVTSGIAAYKIPNLVRLLVKAGAEVQVLTTPAALRFVTSETLSVVSKKPVYSEFFKDAHGEWNNHVELGLWADLFVIAPLTASTLGKLANGISDNLLITTYLSARCPVMLSPAMDLDMYKSKAVQDNLKMLADRGHIVIPPASGELASGLVGEGRMPEPENLFDEIQRFFQADLPLLGKKALVTAGPTYENIDPVRFIGNYSSGKMGYAIANALFEQGADVTLISGPTALPKPNGIVVHHVISADEMFAKCKECAPESEIIVMAAAVADYKPATTASSKIKKKESSMTLDLIKNPDILSNLGKSKSKEQFLVGFALETENEHAHALEKMRTKNADMMVLNSLQNSNAGFGYDTNQVSLLFPNEETMHLPLMTKSEVAKQLVSEIAKRIPVK